MSRSGYTEDCDGWDLIRWRGAVNSAIRGERGQALLRDLRDALDAMPEKRLIENELENRQGEVCALGAVGKRRGLDMSSLDPEEAELVADAFNIAPALAKEIVWINDESSYRWNTTPEQRWKEVRAWVERHLKPATPPVETTQPQTVQEDGRQ